MKPWIKRTLIGTDLRHRRARWPHRLRFARRTTARGWSDERVTEMRGKAVEKISDKLELNAGQKAKLGVLADEMIASRKAMRGESADPRTDMQALIAGDKFDRSQGPADAGAEDPGAAGPRPQGPGRLRRLLRQPQPRAAEAGARARWSAAAMAGGAVADAIHAIARQGRPHTAALLADAEDPHAELLALFWGPRFDREHALALWARFSQRQPVRSRAAAAEPAVGGRALRRAWARREGPAAPPDRAPPRSVRMNR